MFGKSKKWLYICVITLKYNTMSNEIKNYRAALAQTPRNKTAYMILIWEILILSVICALATGHYMHSDMVTLVSFFLYVPILCVLVYLPATQVPAFFMLACFWAIPFVALAIAFGAVMYFFAFIAFVFSFAVHYFGITYLNDLTRED
jgi:hypothetical protein